MVELGAVAAGLSSLKAAGEITKGLIEARDLIKWQGQLIELRSQILAAQEGALAANAAQSELLQQIRSLKEQIAKLETWNTEKERYKLERLPPGVFVYTLKPEMAAGEEPHSICETCYQRGKIRTLQTSNKLHGTYDLKCNECQSVIRVGDPPGAINVNRQTTHKSKYME